MPHLREVQKMKKTAWIALVLAAVGAAACNTTSRLEIPKIASVEAPVIETNVLEQASFRLDRVVARIRRGDTILHFPAWGVDGTDGFSCNKFFAGNAALQWGAGKSELGNWSTELGEVFYEVMKESNVNIMGDPSRLFNVSKEVSGAEYLIGASITEIKGNFCQPTNFWTGTPELSFSGEMYVKVDWTFYSSVQRRELFRYKTEGYAKTVQQTQGGIILTLHNAFADAAQRITTSDDFIALAVRTAKLNETVVRAGEDTITIERLNESRARIEDRMDEVISSVVSVRLGSGHGSGFFITKDGLIMTNAHVVSESENVAVVLSNGLELTGEVVRSHARRDVGLVRVPIRVPNALPIRSKPLKRLDRVFAVGSPLAVQLQSTVTSGAVSAFRRFEDQPLIQADVPVTGGNSGGPLLDEFGNVVGLTVAKFAEGENLNLFIPIMDGLKELNVQISTNPSGG